MSCKFLEQFCMEQTRGSFQVQNTIYHLSSHVIEDTGAYLELFQLYQCEGSALWCHEGEELAELQNGDQNTSLSTVSLKVSHGFLYVYAHNTFDAVLIVCNLSKTAPSCYEANSGEGQLKIAPG